MTFSPMRALAFAIIGLPVGFVLSALALVATGQAIEAQTIASYALAVALTSGVVAGFWKNKE
jgi:hypothetical protein